MERIENKKYIILTRAFPLVAIRCVPTMPKFGRFLTLNQICRRQDAVMSMADTPTSRAAVFTLEHLKVLISSANWKFL